MWFQHRGVVIGGLFASLSFMGGCSGSANVQRESPQPPQLTSAPTPARNEPAHNEEVESLRADVARLERERDNARLWGAEEQQRQERDMHERQRRNEIEAAMWIKLDDADEQVRLLRKGLDNWTIQDRRASIKVYQEALEKRDRIEHDIRRIANEPAHDFNQLKNDVEMNLDQLKTLVDGALASKEHAHGRAGE